MIPPIGLLYLLAAINLRIGYSRLYCNGATPTFRDKVREKLEALNLPVPDWISKGPRSCQ